MRSRRKAREAALQALYQCDTLFDWSDEIVDLYFKVFHTDLTGNLEGSVKENCEFARSLISGVARYLIFIDEQISNASTRWSLGRMSRVDRNILRMSAFEIAFLNDIPVNVSINEAIEIAKKFGTDDSPMFVNGVLDNLASVFTSNPELAAKAKVADKKKVAAAG